MKKYLVSSIKYLVFIFIIFFLNASLLTPHTVYAATGINSTINFQGKVVNKTDGTNISDGTYTFIFALYDASSGGNKKWGDETQNNVSVTNGIFTVTLGSVTPLTGVDFNQDNLWLNITFNGEAFGSRIRFTAVPYAFNASSLDGVVATNSATAFTLSGSTNSLQTLTVNGSITIGSTIQPTAAGALTVQSNGSNTLTLESGGGGISIGTSTGGTVTIGRTGQGITLPGFTTNNNTVLTTNGTGVLSQVTTTSSGLCLTSNGSGAAPTWATCPGGTSSGPFKEVTGANGGIIVPFNVTEDFLVGGTSTSSAATAAKFAVLNMVGAGTPTASVSAGTTGAIFLTATGGLATTANQNLVFGQNSGINTVVIAPNAGGQSALIINKLGNSSDLLTASSSGTTKFVIDANGALTSKATSNQLVLGTTNTVTISATAPSAPRTYTIPDFGSNDSFVGLAATQNLTNKTYNGLTVSGTDPITIQPTSTGALTIQSNGAKAVSIDTGSAAGINIGTTTANGVTIGNNSFANNTFVTLTTGGAGNLTLGSNTGTGGVIVQPNSGGNAALIINKQGYVGNANNFQDLLVASASGVPVFKLDTGGNATLSASLTVGGPASGFPNAVGNFTGTTNSYLQVNIQNKSNGNAASSDFVATADNGNDSANYIDFGINGSGYNQASFNIGGANDGYLYTNGGDLTLGTQTSGTALIFHTSGTSSTNEVMRIDGNGKVGVGTVSTNGPGNGQFVVNQTNSQGTGDIFSASASATTKFVIGNTGLVSLVGGLTSDIDTLTATTLKIGASTQNGLTVGRSGATTTINGSSLTLGAATGVSGALTVTSNSASALAVGLNGTTNPALKVDASTASQQNGVVITGSASSNAVTVGVAGGGTNIPLTINSNGSGALTLDTPSAGTIAIGAIATTLNVGTSNTASTIGIGTGTGGNTINIGTGATSNATQTIHIGDGTPSGTGLTNIIIGNAINTGALTLKSGSGNITLGTTGTNGTVIVQPDAGGTAALIVNKQGASGDIFTASASGTTKFTINNTGAASASGSLTLDTAASIQTTKNQTLNIGGTTTGNIFIQPMGSSGTGRVLIGAGNGGAGSTTPDLLGLDIGSSASDPTGFNGAMYYNTNLGVFRCFQANTWTTCLSGTGSTALNGITAASGSQAGIANGSNTIVWNWGTLTSGTAMTFTGGSAMTTGSVLGLNSTTYTHTTAETGSLQGLSFTDSSTNNTANTNSVTNGLLVSSSINTSGNATKEIDAIHIAAPTLTACSGGACTWTGLKVDTLSSANNYNINAASFGGNVRIENKTNSNPVSFTKISAGTGQIATGGTTPIASVSAMAVYNGSLYIGTGGGAGTQTQGGAEIYQYNGATATSSANWTKVSQTLSGQIANGGTSSIASISAMAVFNGQLYVGTSKTGLAEVYRYDGGTTWTRVNPAAGTFGAQSGQDGVSAMTVYGGKLIIATYQGNAKAIVYRYDGNILWTALSAQGNFTSTTAVDRVSSLAVYNNTLYAGLEKSGATGEIVKWTPTTNASLTVWIRVDSGAGNIGGASCSTAVNDVTAMAVYNGKLYAALQNTSSQAFICRYEDTASAVGIEWSLVTNTATGIIRSGGTSAVSRIASLTVYNGRLYAGTEKLGGAEVYQYIDGDQWSILNATAGTIGSTTAIDKVNALMPYNGSLFVGTGKNAPTVSSAAEVYTFTNTTDQSYALKFHAASSWTSEQNGLTNDGSIWFEASPSGQVNSSITGTGSFIFSNGIITGSGAYDVAEDYPTRDTSIKPGDLVSIDPHEKGLVRRSQVAYDRATIGVYSEKPALHLSQQSTDQINGLPAIAVALAGRVPVNVSTESGAIQPGDYLVSSSVPGIAMKATKAGAIIGQALESFDGNQGTFGKISIFVQHGYYDGTQANTIATTDALTQLATIHATPTTVEDQFASASALFTSSASTSSELALTSLSVDGLARLDDLTARQATVSADLRVKGNGLIEGILSVIDTIKSNNIIITGLADFFGNVIFHQDVTFTGTPIFNNDTAGTAVITKDTDRVIVTFAKPYTTTPLVTATLAVDEISVTPSVTPQNDLQQTIVGRGYTYIIVDKSAKGFTILLNKKAQEDISFSWIALTVNKITTSTKAVAGEHVTVGLPAQSVSTESAEKNL